MLFNAFLAVDVSRIAVATVEEVLAAEFRYPSD